MTPPRSPKLLRGFLLVVILLAGAALGSGCGSDGAGSIHIESSEARREMMKTGAGVAPTAVDKSGSLATPRKSVPGTANKNRTQKKR